MKKIGCLVFTVAMAVLLTVIILGMTSSLHPSPLPIATVRLDDDLVLKITGTPNPESSEVLTLSYDIMNTDNQSVMNGRHGFGATTRSHTNYLQFSLVSGLKDGVYAVVEGSRSNVIRILYDAATGWNWPCCERSATNWQSANARTMTYVDHLEGGTNNWQVEGRMGRLMPEW